MSEIKSVYDMFKTSEKNEKEGIVVDYGPGAGKFRIARMGGSNSAFSRYHTARLKPYKYQIERETISEEILKDIMLDSFVKHVLLSWEGVRGENGKEIPFSEENAKALMQALPELYADLLNQARDFTNFRAAEIQDIAKNSEGTSAGK